MSPAESSPTAPVQTRLVLVLLADKLAAWRLAPGCAPGSLPILGEMRVNATSPQAIAAAYADVAERLRGDGVSVSEVHWLADSKGRGLWAASLPQLQKLPDSPPWQLLAWEWLATRFGLRDAQSSPATDWLASELLPWLVTADDAAERHHMREALAREHHGEAERLAAERARLQQENERLWAQNAALRQVDAERLASFLPALFLRVFTVLGAADLALLCGRVEPLPIPNPYPEPSEETLRTLQKDFRALPRELQRQIAGFVARLPQRQRLQPRQEMRELLRQLEEA
jgi:hypothetical protein